MIHDLRIVWIDKGGASSALPLPDSRCDPGKPGRVEREPTESVARPVEESPVPYSSAPGFFL
jgi:hypothetical protein